MLGRIRRTINGSMRNKNGATLVELLVTFALIGIFMAAVTAMLMSSLRLFGRMQDTSSAVTVSDLILDKITGEITAADIPEKGSTASSGYYFWLEPKQAAEGSRSGEAAKSRWVVFRNRSGSPIGIFAGESGDVSPENMGKGQLFIKYYAVSKDKQKEVEEIDWHFDNNVYMGYKITDLYFEQEDPEHHPNVVTVHLTIKNERTGFEYSAHRYAECYNYDGDYMFARNDTAHNFPKEAEEFEIKNPGGEPDGPTDPTDPSEPTEPELPTEPTGPTEPDKPDPQKYAYVLQCYISSIYNSTYYSNLSKDGYKLSGGLEETHFLGNIKMEASWSDKDKIVDTPLLFDGYLPVTKQYIIKLSEYETVWINDYIYYEPVDVKLILRAVCGDEILLPDTEITAKYKTVVRIDGKPEISGYECLTKSQQSIIRIMGKGELIYEIEYIKLGNHPYKTVSNDITVYSGWNIVQDSKWKSIGEAAIRFFNSEWEELGTVDKSKVYGTTFEVDGKKYALLGKEDGSKLKEDDAQKIAKENLKKDFEEIGRIKAGEIKGIEAEELLEYLASVYMSKEDQELIDDADDIKFVFSEEYGKKTQIEKIVFETDSSPKEKITISFKIKY